MNKGKPPTRQQCVVNRRSQFMFLSPPDIACTAADFHHPKQVSYTAKETEAMLPECVCKVAKSWHASYILSAPELMHVPATRLVGGIKK